jgi:hypothetical protein
MYMSIMTRNNEQRYSCLHTNYETLITETYKVLRPGDFVDTFEAEYDGAYFYPAEGLDCFVVNLDGVLEEIDPEEDS